MRYDVQLRGRETSKFYPTLRAARDAALEMKAQYPDRRVLIWQGLEKVEEVTTR